MPLKELPNRAQILAAKKEAKELRKLNTKRFDSLIIEHYDDGSINFRVSENYDVYDSTVFYMEVKEMIEFLQRRYRYK